MPHSGPNHSGQQAWAAQQTAGQPGENTDQPGSTAPWTRAGWGLLPTVLGLLAALAGPLALDWVGGYSLGTAAGIYDRDIAEGVLPSGIGSQAMAFYLRYGVFVLVGIQAIYMISWTAGGVRGTRSARMILSTAGTSVARGKLGAMNALMVCASAVVLAAHAIAIWKITEGDLADAGAGAWTLLAGTLLMGIGAGMGPRPGR